MKFRNRTNKQNSTNYSDHWLAFKNGDNTGLESIYKDYAADLMAYGYRIYADEHLVKDVIQDVSTKISTK